MGWRNRQRRGRRGRFPKPIALQKPLAISKFSSFPESSSIPILIEPAEIEALRLVDLEGLSQEEAGERMGVSRGTIWRLLQEARSKIAQALTECRSLHVITGPASEDDPK